jgi:ferredoxin
MTKYKIKYKAEECIGCTGCTQFGDNWEMDWDTSKAKPKKAEFEEDELESNKEAASICPVQGIKIVNTETGEEVQ